MSYKTIVISLLFLLKNIHSLLFSQVYPSFGDEKQESINGLTFDAIEPFISPDGTVEYY